MDPYIAPTQEQLREAMTVPTLDKLQAEAVQRGDVKTQEAIFRFTQSLEAARTAGQIEMRKQLEPLSPTELRKFPGPPPAGTTMGQLEKGLTSETAPGRGGEKPKGGKPIAPLMEQPSPEERHAAAQRGVALDITRRIIDTAAAHPDWFGGMLGWRGKTMEWLTNLDLAPEGFPQLANDINRLRSELIRAMAGANVGPAEREAYFKTFPNISSDSRQAFLANVHGTLANIEALDRRAAAVQQRSGVTPLPQAPVAPPKPPSKTPSKGPLLSDEEIKARIAEEIRRGLQKGTPAPP
jgi:hypothetical protein